jgi:prepilin-type N-terminal cleavage/methylation domain-containing protein
MNKSFTLIEILVVIVVIGVLSAFILVGMSSITNSANIAKGKAFANSLRNSLLINLVSEWKLDGNGSDSWGTNNGTLVGPTHLPILKTGPDCVSGSCYQFDAIDDYINVPDNDSLKIMNRITLEVWINPVLQAGSWRGIINRETASTAGYTIRTTNSYDAASTGIQFQISNGSERNVVSSVNNNKWSHLVGTYDGNNLKLYINGVLLSPTPSTDGIANIFSALNIGKLSYGSGDFFKGLIDEARVYNESLSSFQINQNYFVGLNKLFKNNCIGLNEFNDRLVELKFNLSSR